MYILSHSPEFRHVKTKEPFERFSSDTRSFYGCFTLMGLFFFFMDTFKHLFYRCFDLEIDLGFACCPESGLASIHSYPLSYSLLLLGEMIIGSSLSWPFFLVVIPVSVSVEAENGVTR